MLNIKIILGSTRPDRFSEHAGAWIYEIAKKRDDIAVELLDLRDWPLPFYNEPLSPTRYKEAYPNPEVDKWAQKITEADGFVWVTPEYNHGTSAVLKNALDSIFKEWNDKAVGFVGYGSVGGARAVEHLRQYAVELRMVSTRDAVHIFEPWNLLDENQKLKPGVLDEHKKSAEAMLENLVFLSRGLEKSRKEES